MGKQQQDLPTQEQFIFHNKEGEWGGKRGPAPSPEIRLAFVDAVYGEFLGNSCSNSEAVKVLKSIAFDALSKYNHVTNEVHVALIGPPCSERTELINLHNRSRQLPLVEISPRTVKTVCDMFEQIGKVALAATLPLIELGWRHHYVLPPMDILIEDPELFTSSFRQELGKAIECGTLETEMGHTLDCKNIHWIIVAADSGAFFGAFDTRFTAIQSKRFVKIQLGSQSPAQDSSASTSQAQCQERKTMMSELPRLKLKEILSQVGNGLVTGDPKRLEGLLRDNCPECKREVHLLVVTLKAGLAADVLTISAAESWESLCSRWVHRLTRDFAITDVASRWVVETWGAALGVAGRLPKRPERDAGNTVTRTDTMPAGKEIAIVCPQCQSLGSGTDNVIGKNVQCSQCLTTFIVPDYRYSVPSTEDKQARKREEEARQEAELERKRREAAGAARQKEELLEQPAAEHARQELEKRRQEEAEANARKKEEEESRQKAQLERKRQEVGELLKHFTDGARKVMQLANQEAQRFNHEYLGTEHMLLGLVKDGLDKKGRSGVAVTILKNLGVDLKKTRRAVEAIVQSGPDMVTMGKLPHTPKALAALEYAIDEARSLDHKYVSTEHLLLGLLRVEDGVACKVLLTLGATVEGVREEVMNLLAEQARQKLENKRQNEGEAEARKKTEEERKQRKGQAKRPTQQQKEQPMTTTPKPAPLPSPSADIVAGTQERWRKMIQLCSGIEWPFSQWEKEKPTKGTVSQAKLALITKSLELIRGQNGNEDACRKIVEAALDAGLHDLAFAAMRAFGPDAAFNLCVCVKQIVQPIGNWRLFDDGFVSFAEKRVLNAKECKSGMYMGDFQPDQRSEALGSLGRYRFLHGDVRSSIRLWEAAGEQRNVDEALAEISNTIAKHAFEHFTVASAMIECVSNGKIRDKGRAEISETIAKHGSEHVEAAMAMLESVSDANIKAKGMVALMKYVK